MRELSSSVLLVLAVVKERPWGCSKDAPHHVPSVTPTINAADVKRFKQLESQAKNIICGHLSKGQYGRVSALETTTLIWDRLSKVSEGVTTQRDSRVDVLRNLFNRVKRLNNENVQQTFDRLTGISNELKHLVSLTSPTMRW